jgi:hypothetical protein
MPPTPSGGELNVADYNSLDARWLTRELEWPLKEGKGIDDREVGVGRIGKVSGDGVNGARTPPDPD